MGLFDKKKKAQNTAEAAAENINLEDADVTESVDTGRRFSVIVDGVTTMLDGNGSIVSGNLYGKIKKGDKVFVYMAGTPAVACEVQAIEAKNEERTSIVDEAEDTAVSLQLTLPDEVQLKKYSVITNIEPQDKVDPKVSIENPALAGIINGMTTYSQDNGFHATVAYHVSHGHFLTPIKMDAEPEVNENGVAVIKKDTRIGFYMLKSQIKLAGTPEDRDSMVLPLFTDWQSLRKWEGLTKDGQKVHTQILSFQDVYALLKRGDAYAGIAINPFNKIPCTLPIPYLDTITGTPGYQAEFGPKNEGEGHVKEEKVPAGKKILLGVPKDGEETSAIRAKLLEYGKSHEDIYSISFLTKVEEDTKVVRHLVVLEFPVEYTPENMKPHMEAIYQELAPIAKEINQIEYAIKGRIPAIDDVVAQHALQMVVYTK
ncbi:SseB protein N-terminal domain-containing protein [Pseudobutyrivibrio sp. OR37]|uniref:SseB family protein n=1 Tax=Pseudobutyrivibrio sp. OR37 TaxID=1798186 RepID=UPI0008EC39DC|nr:SseB family protein [Pseudobutyrivibrio sp. OR37]SFH64913.1 SseB protein N-terminal domain-containing protein [Pseudobutyrivibrio sp. OR37]